MKIYLLSVFTLILILALIVAVFLFLEKFWDKAALVMKVGLNVVAAYLSVLYILINKDELTILATAVVILSCVSIYELIKEYFD